MTALAAKPLNPNIRLVIFCKPIPANGAKGEARLLDYASRLQGRSKELCELIIQNRPSVRVREPEGCDGLRSQTPDFVETCGCRRGGITSKRSLGHNEETVIALTG